MADKIYRVPTIYHKIRKTADPLTVRVPGSKSITNRSLLLAMLADAIGLLVVGIVKLVYLYRTAKRFREYQPAALQKEVL